MKSTWAFEKTTGGRVKRLAERNGYTRTRLAAALGGYADNSITRFYSGKQHFSDDQLEKLAELFGVQVEFLKCESDYETFEDMVEDFRNENIMSHKIIVTYLKSLGIDIVAKTYFIGTRSELYQSYFDIEDVLSAKTKELLPSYIELPSHDQYRDLLDSPNLSSRGLPYCDELYDALYADSKKLFGDDSDRIDTASHCEYLLSDDYDYFSDSYILRPHRFFLGLVANPRSGSLAKMNAFDVKDPVKIDSYAEDCHRFDDALHNDNWDAYHLEECGLSKENCSFASTSAGRIDILYSVSLKGQFHGLFTPDDLQHLFGTLNSTCLTVTESLLDPEHPTIRPIANYKVQYHSTIL